MPFTKTPLAFLAALTVSLSVAIVAPAQGPGGDSLYKSWYFTPTGIFGRQPLARTKTSFYCKISHPSADLAVIQSINPAGITFNTTRFYFRNGLISRSTETNRWGETFDSTWFQSEGPGKFLVTKRTRGVNPYLPCKFKEFTFKDDMLTDITGYLDSLRAGPDRNAVIHYKFERYTDPSRRALIQSESFFGDLDLPVTSRFSDCHKLTNEYNDKGDLVSTRSFDENDQPTVDRSGVSLTKYKYDGDGNETEAQFFNTAGKPTSTVSGYSYRVRDYRRGYLSEESYLTADYKPAIAREIGDHVSIVDQKVDRDGNVTEISYFDPDHTPVNATQKFDRIDNVYSATGMLVETDMSQRNDRGDEQRVFAVKYDRSELAQISTQHYELMGHIIMADPDNGAYYTKYTYDGEGRLHSSACWQNDSTRMSCRLGYHEIVYHYDGDGQLAERDFFDEYGQPSGGRIGYSRELQSRNAFGLAAERRYFIGDRPVLLRDSRASVSNFHRVRYDYDLLNRLRSVTFFDENGKPIDAVLRTDAGHTFNASAVSLEYNGDDVTTEILNDSTGNTQPVALDCSKDQCLAISALENLRSPQTRVVPSPLRQYHGKFRPDTLFANQLGFIGRDSVLVFITGDWGAQTDFGCGEYYRVEPINQFYQEDGRVTDYFMDNDSVAATFSYVRGHLQGPVYLFYPNGRIRERGTYRNDVPYGTWDYYYDNGQKQRTLEYTENEVFVEDCYSRNGDVLAQNGNGKFEGLVAAANVNNTLPVIAKGGLKGGVPDGEWQLFVKQLTRPWATENFSNGKFRYGISHSLLGTTRYSGACHASVEGLHGYENLDSYRHDGFCRMAGILPLAGDNYREIRQGMLDILKTNKFQAYTGWIFLDVLVDSNGHVTESHIRLHHPNAELARDVHDMAAGLVYTPLITNHKIGASFEKLYVILLSNNEVVIPEEVVQNSRNKSR